MINILVVARDNLRHLKNLVESTRKNTKVPYIISVWDNGSPLSMEEWCSQQEDIKYYRTETNVGIPVAANTMCRESHYDNVLVIDPDTYLLPGWDSAVKVVDKHGGWRGLIEIGTAKPKRSIHGSFGTELETFEREKLELQFKNYVHPVVLTSPFMPAVLKKDDWIKFGGYEERFLCAEIYFIWRAFHFYKDQGRRMLSQPDSLYYHLDGSGSWRPANYSSLVSEWSEAFEKDYGEENHRNYHNIIERWTEVGPSVNEDNEIIYYK